jgi:endo-1,4-beta-xylanase
VRTWDVINEPVRPADGRADGLRRKPLLSRLGPEYLEHAPHTAREADGSTRLCVSEFDLEYDTPYFEKRRTAMLRIVERLKAKGAPLDAVGLQSHLAAGIFPFSEHPLRAFLAELASLSVRIELTELDVADAGLPADATERDRLIADEYERYLAVALDEPATDVVATWGLSDRYTWLNTDSAPSRKGGPTGRPAGRCRSMRICARSRLGAPSLVPSTARQGADLSIYPRYCISIIT